MKNIFYKNGFYKNHYYSIEQHQTNGYYIGTVEIGGYYESFISYGKMDALMIIKEKVNNFLAR